MVGLFYIIHGLFYTIYVHEEIYRNPPNPGREKFAIERTPFHQTNNKRKHPQSTASRNLRENPHRILKRLAVGVDLTFWTRSLVIYNP